MVRQRRFHNLCMRYDWLEMGLLVSLRWVCLSTFWGTDNIACYKLLIKKFTTIMPETTNLLLFQIDFIALPYHLQVCICSFISHICNCCVIASLAVLQHHMLACTDIHNDALHSGFTRQSKFTFLLRDSLLKCLLLGGFVNRSTENVSLLRI